METDKLLDAINDVSKNYQPLNQDVVVTKPSKEDLVNAMKKGDLVLGIKLDNKIANNETPVTVMAIGPRVEGILIGQKVILKGGVQGANYPIIKIKGKEYLQVADFHVLGIVKGDIS